MNANEFALMVKLLSMDLGPEKMQILKELVEQTSRTSSIEVGTPGKSGAIKVYVNPANPEQSATYIREMVRLRNLLNDEAFPLVKVATQPEVK